MGLFSQVSSAVARGGQGLKTSKDERPPEGANAEDTEELDEESGNILLSLISQLRIGMDLHKVTLPTFVLEPRSMLERVTDFLSHPEVLVIHAVAPFPAHFSDLIPIVHYFPINHVVCTSEIAFYLEINVSRHIQTFVRDLTLVTKLKNHFAEKDAPSVHIWHAYGVLAIFRPI